jgi:hypothetical protein
MGLEESLEELAMLWIVHLPSGSVVNANFENMESTEIPLPLISTITNKEPYRSQVLADVKIYLRCPAPNGLGRYIEIKRPLDVIPFDEWAQTISPLKFRVHWSVTMSGDNWDYANSEIERVVFEENQWKIASLWNERAREDTMKLIEWLRKRKRAE